ncbi:hypothetical protein Syun_025113 [Stephania yunnanensis]|uniref:HNH endonuclease 5 domain-containing protein n=1 Tax=Stephania yunnanensis TaxID=152371 RepID=A0AAP0HQY4_9MAGN
MWISGGGRRCAVVRRREGWALCRRCLCSPRHWSPLFIAALETIALCRRWLCSPRRCSPLFVTVRRCQADVLEYYDQTVNSSNGSFYIPAVLRVPHLLQVVKRRRIKQNLSRKNIFLDMFTCQYCCSRENLTIDHVLPISRGGEWKWENLVTSRPILVDLLLLLFLKLQ